MDYNLKFMKRAIKIAQENIDSGGGPFGAVIVKNGLILAEAGNAVTKNNDPTAHAEIQAIRLASAKLKNFDLKDCDIYSSCEPCPMCLGAIYWAHLNKLFFAGLRVDAANAGFDDEFIYNELKLQSTKRSLYTKNILRQEALNVFEYWIKKEDKIKY